MVLSRTFIPTHYEGGPGTAVSKYSISSFVLFGVRILGVKRNGLAYNRTLTNPVPLSNQYFAFPGGTIRFNADLPFQHGESVWVIWEV